MAYRSTRIIRNLLFILLLVAGASSLLPAQTPVNTSASRQAGSPTALIRWRGRSRVRRYRLQLARDAKFRDIVFDRAVEGLEYLVTELPAGSYYWRVAPATPETGIYSRPVPVVVSIQTARTPQPTPTPTPQARPSPTPMPTPTPPKVLSPGDTGWRTATGEVTQPRVAPLRTASNMDLVGVNSDGMVYALDGSNGVALWTARFRPAAKKGEPTGNGEAADFAPVIIGGEAGLANVVVAFEGGVRALQGASGRELWRTSLQGRATSGLAADIDGDGKTEIVIAEDDPAHLAILNEAGKFIAEVKLEAGVIGAPVQLVVGAQRGVIVVLENGMIEMRNVNGERVRAVKIDTKPTTPLLVVQKALVPVGLLGVEGNLIALDLNDPNLKPTGRIATEDDSPRGELSTVDLEGDGAQEVVMVTRMGRAVVINASDGKIKWFATGATDAASAAFADVNADGVLDVLVAAGSSFAVALSGRDGSLVWKAEEPGSGAPAGTVSRSIRGLVAATVGEGKSAFLVGSDPARTGLRAVGLPQGSVKSQTR